MTVETIAIPIGCPACGGHLTAVGGPTDHSAPETAWECAYCHAKHTTDFGGQVVWIARRTTDREQTH